MQYSFAVVGLLASVALSAPVAEPEPNFPFPSFGLPSFHIPGYPQPTKTSTLAYQPPGYGPTQSVHYGGWKRAAEAMPEPTAAPEAQPEANLPHFGGLPSFGLPSFALPSFSIPSYPTQSVHYGGWKRNVPVEEQQANMHAAMARGIPEPNPVLVA